MALERPKAALRRPFGTGEDGRKDSVLVYIGATFVELKLFLRFFANRASPGQWWFLPGEPGSRLSGGFRKLDLDVPPLGKGTSIVIGL